MKEDRINICYAISDKTGNYTKIAGTSICSLLENTKCATLQDSAPYIYIYILHDGTLTAKNQEYLYKLVEENYGQKLCLYDVSREYAEIWEKIKDSLPGVENSRLSMATFYRLVMGEILSKEKRIIYLDADVIVNLDICELWEEQTGVNGIGAAPDPFIQKYHHNMTRKALIPQKEYFNAGVLLIDLDKFRLVDNLMDKAIDFIKKHNPDYLDQDILNYFFPGSCVLDSKYNSLVWMEHDVNRPVSRRIYHYVNNCLGLDMKNDYNALFFRYFSYTPWCDESFIGNMFKFIEQAKFEMLDFCNKCANRRRIVVALENAMDSMCNMLNLGNDEIFIPFEHLEEYQTEFNKEKDVFLLVLTKSDYNSLKQSLEAFGLVENVHFVNLLQKIGMFDGNLQDYKIFLHC